MKKISIDSMMNRGLLRKLVRFEDIRSEAKEISLEQLAENRKNKLFYTNFNGGMFYPKDELLEICKLFDLKVVYWDYVRMLAKVEGVTK